MARVLSAAAERFPIAGTFTISRGSKTEAEVIVATISQDGKRGRGECVPYRRYGETVESVTAAIESVRADIENGADRVTLAGAVAGRRGTQRARLRVVGPGGKALRGNRSPAAICRKSPAAIVTAYTLSLGTPEAMAAQARANAARPLLKVKIGGDGDIERIRAVVERRAAQPHHPRRQ